MNYLLIGEAAKIIGKSPRTVHRMTAAGRIPFRRLPHSRRCLFQADWLEQWANGCELEKVALPGNGVVVRPVAEAALTLEES